jgi:hypothetical protein
MWTGRMLDFKGSNLSHSIQGALDTKRHIQGRHEHMHSGVREVVVGPARLDVIFGCRWLILDGQAARLGESFGDAVQIGGVHTEGDMKRTGMKQIAYLRS